MTRPEEPSYGDPKRCPVHGTVISDPYGLYDGLCGACEEEADMAQYHDAEDTIIARTCSTALRWMNDHLPTVESEGYPSFPHEMQKLHRQICKLRRRYQKLERFKLEIGEFLMSRQEESSIQTEELIGVIQAWAAEEDPYWEV